MERERTIRQNRSLAVGTLEELWLHSLEKPE